MIDRCSLRQTGQQPTVGCARLGQLPDARSGQGNYSIPCATARLGPLCALLLLGLLLLAACTPPAAPVSKELHLYTFAAYLPEALITGFEQKSGIKVTVDTYVNNEELLAKLAANPTAYDLLIPTDYAVEILINSDSLLPLDLAKIPNYNNIERAFLSPYFDPGGATAGRRPAARNQKFSLPFQWGTTGIAYDTAKISDPLTSWADLWRPDLQGHLVVLDDSRELLGIALLTLGFDKNSTNPAQLVAARDKLAALTPGVIAFDSAEPEKYLLSGEAWAGVVFNGNAALAQQANPQITYVFPKEGVGIWFDNMVIPAQAPHADAALAFINYVLAPENSLLITEKFPYSNPNQAALAYLQETQPERYAAYMDNPITNPPAATLDAARPVKNVGEATSAIYQQYWEEVKQ